MPTEMENCIILYLDSYAYYIWKIPFALKQGHCAPSFSYLSFSKVYIISLTGGLIVVGCQVQAQKDSKMVTGNNLFPSWNRCAVYYEASNDCTEEKCQKHRSYLKFQRVNLVK